MKLLCIWNRACDYAINQLLKDAGFILPGHVLLYNGYKGMWYDVHIPIVDRLYDEHLALLKKKRG